MIFDDHVANFNKKRARNYHPSYSTCVDESMLRWYDIGGHWINACLPQYITIDKNPKNRFDIHNATYRVSGIMIELKLVKTSSGEDIHYPEEHDGLLHGTKLMLNIFGAMGK